MTKTRNPDRIDVVLEAVRMYWINNTDMRLGQIISNVAYAEGCSTTFSLEDHDLVTNLLTANYFVEENNE